MVTRARARLQQIVGGLAVIFAVMTASGVAGAAPIVFQVGGNDTAASIQATVDAFRAALGDPNNGNAGGPLASGRREINWDGGGSTATTAPVTPFTTFLNTRGGLFTTAGTGLSQATPDGLATLFANPGYADSFSAFSPARLFTPVGSNITDATFFIPGTAGAQPATISGFGAVFTDVDLPDATRLQFFDDEGELLFTFSVPVGTVADGSLSFLGVVFNAGELISRVRITTGTTALGPNDNPVEEVDVVAMDDFLYAEPVALAAAPEPAMGAASLLAFGIALALGFGRRRT